MEAKHVEEKLHTYISSVSQIWQQNSVKFCSEIVVKPLSCKSWDLVAAVYIFVKWTHVLGSHAISNPMRGSTEEQWNTWREICSRSCGNRYNTILYCITKYIKKLIQ